MKLGTMTAAAVIATLGAPADAATITQYRNISTYIPFDGFSASLGTLDSVTLEVSVRTYRQWFVNTPSGSPANTVTWSIDSYFDVLANLGGSPLTTGFPLRVGTAGSGSLVQNEGVFNIFALGTGTFNLDPSLLTGSQPLVVFHSDPGLSLASENGTTIGSSVDGTLIQTFGTCGFGITSSGCGFGNATLTYNYTPGSAAVPEPAAWAMMIGGLGLIGGALRGARRKAARVSFA